MTSHPGLRNPADAQDVFAFLYHLKESKRASIFYITTNSITEMTYSNIILKRQQLRLLREVNEIIRSISINKYTEMKEGSGAFLFIHVY